MVGISSRWVERVFQPPGCAGNSSSLLLDEAARAHAHLILSASANPNLLRGGALTTLAGFVRSSFGSARWRKLLGHPLLIEALHRLAAGCEDLERWDRAVAAGVGHDDLADSMATGEAMLGNVVLPLLLSGSSAWCGEIDLCTDSAARLQFPMCDWSIALRAHSEADQEAVFRQPVRFTLDRQSATWRLMGSEDTPVLVMGRQACYRMLVDNDSSLDLTDLDFPHPSIRSRLQYATQLGASGIRYDPALFEDFASHADITGGIVQVLLEAIHQNAPDIYEELCAYVATIRGFELPESHLGTVASFSVPVSPGIIGLNISYTQQHEPRLDPFCFAWLGHELGHTKHYLIDDVAFSRGWTFVTNPHESTDPIERYGRPLTVRTLMQMPYVHLYELILLMDFVEAQFRGLPWRVGEDWHRFGDELIDEIHDALELIDQYARLTAMGELVIARMRHLFAETLKRWRVPAAQA